MSRFLFDFVCKKGHTHEALAPANRRVVACPECGEFAKRIISPVRSVLDGCSGDFPTAADAWEKRRQSRMKWEQRNTERHGKTGIGHDK